MQLSKRKTQGKNWLDQHLVMLISWSIIMVLFLIPRYSTVNLIVFFIGVVILFYTYLFKIDTTEMSALYYMDEVFGISTIVLLLFRCSAVAISKETFALSRISSLCLDFFKRLPYCFKEGDRVLVCVLIVLFLVGLLKIKKDRYAWLEVFYRYLVYWTIFSIAIYSWTEKKDILLIYTLIAMFSYLITFFQRISFISSRASSIKWFVWFSTLLLISIIFIFPDADTIISQRTMEQLLFEEVLNVQNILLILMLFLFDTWLFGILCKKEPVSDDTIPATFFSLLLVLYLTHMFYVAYWWLFILVDWIGIQIIAEKYSRKESTVENRMESWVKYLLLTGVIIGISFSAHNGRILSSLVFLSSILVVSKYAIKWKSESKSWKGNNRFFVLVFLVIGLTTASRLWEVRNLFFSFFILLVLTVVFILFNYVYSYSFDGVSIEGNEYGNGLLLVLFSILCLSLCLKGGSDIKVNDKAEGKVQVTVEARGKNNKIESVEAFWMDDFWEAMINREEKSLPHELTYIDISSGDILKIGNGRLRIIATDSYGIETTLIKWFHSCTYEEE